MRKVIAAINMTLDGFCDHTAIDPDEEIHQHYQDLICNADVILYGRITYGLMKYWKDLVEQPSGNQDLDNFALAMDKVTKIVFSNTLKEISWQSAKLENRSIETVVSELKQQTGKPILIGSRSLILQLMHLDLIDEYQICVHPVVVGGGLPLFEKTNSSFGFNLLQTKTFQGGAILLFYRRAIEELKGRH